MPTIPQLVAAQLDEESYASCWLEGPRPGFGEFLAFATAAFEKVLPADVTDLQIQIASTSVDRINTSGTFRSGGLDFEIVGQIVWVSEQRFFRGRPICQRPTERRPAPPDTSDHFELVQETTRDPDGFGTTLSVSPYSLIEAFGEPGEGDDYKVSGMYFFEGNGGSVFRLYDWQETTLYWENGADDDGATVLSPAAFWCSAEEYDFHVAGNADPSVFVAWLKEQLEQTTK